MSLKILQEKMVIQSSAHLVILQDTVRLKLLLKLGQEPHLEQEQELHLAALQWELL